MMKNSIFIVSLFITLISSCKAQVSKEDKEWLIKKTLNDLVFVEWVEVLWKGRKKISE